MDSSQRAIFEKLRKERIEQLERHLNRLDKKDILTAGKKLLLGDGFSLKEGIIQIGAFLSPLKMRFDRSNRIMWVIPRPRITGLWRRNPGVLVYVTALKMAIARYPILARLTGGDWRKLMKPEILAKIPPGKLPRGRTTAEYRAARKAHMEAVRKYFRVKPTGIQNERFFTGRQQQQTPSTPRPRPRPTITR